MAQPWATLRALGLFKLPGYTWGIDYITEQACEWPMATMGFRGRIGNLLERGIKGYHSFQAKVTLKSRGMSFV
jgi:hypothetical protein